MARRKNKRDRRDDLYTSLTQLPRPTTVEVPIRLSLIEDRRTYHPEAAYRPLQSYLAAPKPRILHQEGSLSKKGSKAGRRSLLSSRLQMATPNTTIVCVRRQQRKEVLFAKRKTGKGGQRSPRKNQWSEISCSRR